MSEVLLHLIGPVEWARVQAEGELRPDPAVGFVHLCTPGQLPFVARRFYAGRDDMRVLLLDPAALGADIRWEVSEPGLPPFPHLYGPLPLAAVQSSHPLETDP